MIKIIANVFVLIALSFTSIVSANNEVKQTQIEVSVNILSLNNDAIQQQKGRNSTVFYTTAGASTVLDIGKNNDKFTMDMKVNDLATQYDLSFLLDNESEISMPGITSYQIGDDLVFTAKINGASKQIKVMTKVVDETSKSQLAMKMLRLANNLFFKKSSQQYFELDNFWKSDSRRFRMMNKGIITQQGRFFYLTNTDPNRAIKGVIEFKTPNNREVRTTQDNIGIRNFGLKDNQLTFVVLPGKTVLIGRWFRPVNLKIKEASFLSNEEVKNLKTTSE